MIGLLGRAERVPAVLSLLLIFLAAGSTVRAETTSAFAVVRLPRGVELELPKGWWMLGEDYQRLIQPSVEAAMDLSGLGLPEGQEINLIAANSMPRSTYAAVRIDSGTPPSMSPAAVSALSAAELRAIATETHTNLQKILPMQGNELIEFLGVRLDRISGYPALVTEYRRTGPKGPVFVQVNIISTPSQDIRVNLSYRESEVAVWGPVIGKMRKSIVVRRWP